MISTTSSLFIFSRNAISMSTESEVLPLVMIQSVNKARLGFRSSRNSSIWDSLWPVTKWHTMTFTDKYVINKDITKPCSSLMPTYNKKFGCHLRTHIHQFYCISFLDLALTIKTIMTLNSTVWPLIGRLLTQYSPMSLARASQSWFSSPELSNLAAPLTHNGKEGPCFSIFPYDSSRSIEGKIWPWKTR